MGGIEGVAGTFGPGHSPAKAGGLIGGGGKGREPFPPPPSPYPQSLLYQA